MTATVIVKSNKVVTAEVYEGEADEPIKSTVVEPGTDSTFHISEGQGLWIVEDDDA